MSKKAKIIIAVVVVVFLGYSIRQFGPKAPENEEECIETYGENARWIEAKGIEGEEGYEYGRCEEYSPKYPKYPNE